MEFFISEQHVTRCIFANDNETVIVTNISIDNTNCEIIFIEY